MTNVNPPKPAEVEKKKPSLREYIGLFERSVKAKAFDKAIAELREILGILESGKEGFGGQLTAVSVAAEQESTLLAAAITNLLVDEDFVLTRNFLMVFAQQKRAISQTFEVSGFRGTAHFLRMIGTRGDNGSTTFKGTELPKLFCALSLNAMNEQLFQLFLRQKPDVTWPIVNGFLSEQILWSPNAEKVRAKILASGAHWENISVGAQAIKNIGPAYMGCSYADAPHKHDIKKTMNKLVRRWLDQEGVTDIAEQSAGRRGVKRKPTLIVMAELYHSTHAMHRCYGPAIRSLKDRFKLVYMSLDGKCDEELHYMFDKIDDTKFDFRNPKLFFDKAKSYRPDVVYYPSIGMRAMSIVGSNVRLAPIQLMTFGHPATTHSEQMDYAVLVDGQVGAESTVNETILYRPTTPRWQRRSDALDVDPQIAVNPDVVRIAVPAWSRKVTPAFLALCQEIQQKAKKKVEFVFFPNGVGSLFQAFKRRVESMMSARALPRTNYNNYIKNLNSCDIFLSTFPFGATNGILDAAMQGIPVVNMKGGEVHAANDSDIVAKFKQPEWLTTSSHQEYVEAVLRLIHNDDERVAISQAIADFDHSLGLFVDQNEHCEEFGVAVEAAYRKHENIIASSKASWPYLKLSEMLDVNEVEEVRVGKADK